MKVLGLSLQALPVAIFALLTASCMQPPAVVKISAVPGESEARYRELDEAGNSKAAAAVKAALNANKRNADGLPKLATSGALSVASGYLPEPTDIDRGEAQALVDAALSGDIDTARKGWALAHLQAGQLRGQLVTAQAAADQERKDNAAKWEKAQHEWKAALDDQRRKAEADTRRLVGYIFFGGGAVCLAVGVGCVTVFSSLPFVCGKFTQGCFALAAILSIAGIGLLEALSHTWIVYAGCAAAVLAVVVVTLGYANHWHAKSDLHS